MAAESPPENVGLPSWIDRDFLERVLGEGGGELLDYKLTKTGSKDEGYASDMYYITLHVGTGGDHVERETRRLVAKCLPSGGQHQDYVRRCSAFPRENGVYTDALPRMQRLLKGASSRGQTPLAPRLYYSQQTPETVLLLEDLTTAGFKMVTPKHQGLSLAHCRLVLRQLASLHASSAMLMVTDPTSVELYKEPLVLETEVDRQHWGGVFPGLARQLAAEVLTWPEFGERSKEQLHRFADNLMENLERVLKRDDEGFNVLNHGDLWVNNLMFRYDDATGDVREVRFLDFQNVQFTSPTIDLQYFLVVSPDADVRAHHCDRLLEEYQEELSLLLTALGYPRRIPSLSDLKEEIERKAFHGLFAAVTDLAILLSEDGFEYDSTLQGGGNSVFSSRKYRDVMYKLLPIFEEKGVI